VGYANGYNRTRCLRSYKLLTREQLIVLHGLVRNAVAPLHWAAHDGWRRREVTNHHRDAARVGFAATGPINFVRSCAEFQVGDNQMACRVAARVQRLTERQAAALAIAVLLEHSAYETAPRLME